MSGESYFHRQSQLMDLAYVEDTRFHYCALYAIVKAINLGDSGDSCKQCAEAKALAGLREYASDDSTTESVEAVINSSYCLDHV